MLKNQDGTAFVGVIMVVLIFSSLCAAILILAEQEYLMARNTESALEAMYAAEGGIQIVLQHMQNNPDITFQEIQVMCSNLTTHRPNIGKAIIEEIIPTDNKDNVVFTVVASSGTAKKVLVAYVSKPSGQGTSWELNIWREQYDIY